MADYKTGGKIAVPRHRVQSRQSSDRQERAIEKTKRQKAKRTIRDGQENDASYEYFAENRMEAFRKLSEQTRLGHYLWANRVLADVELGEKGVGIALHSVVSLVVNAYREPELRKKLEALVLEV